MAKIDKKNAALSQFTKEILSCSKEKDIKKAVSELFEAEVEVEAILYTLKDVVPFFTPEKNEKIKKAFIENEKSHHINNKISTSIELFVNEKKASEVVTTAKENTEEKHDKKHHSKEGIEKKHHRRKHAKKPKAKQSESNIDVEKVTEFDAVMKNDNRCNVEDKIEFAADCYNSSNVINETETEVENNDDASDSFGILSGEFNVENEENSDIFDVMKKNDAGPKSNEIMKKNEESFVKGSDSKIETQPSNNIDTTINNKDPISKSNDQLPTCAKSTCGVVKENKKAVESLVKYFEKLNSHTAVERFKEKSISKKSDENLDTSTENHETIRLGNS